MDVVDLFILGIFKTFAKIKNKKPCFPQISFFDNVLKFLLSQLA